MRVLPKELFVCIRCAIGLVKDEWPKDFTITKDPDPYEGSRGEVVYAYSWDADRVPKLEDLPEEEARRAKWTGWNNEAPCPCCSHETPMVYGFWKALTVLAV